MNGRVSLVQNHVPRRHGNIHRSAISAEYSSEGKQKGEMSTYNTDDSARCQETKAYDSLQWPRLVHILVDINDNQSNQRIAIHMRCQNRPIPVDADSIHIGCPLFYTRPFFHDFLHHGQNRCRQVISIRQKIGHLRHGSPVVLRGSFLGHHSA